MLFGVRKKAWGVAWSAFFFFLSFSSLEAWTRTSVTTDMVINIFPPTCFPDSRTGAIGCLAGAEPNNEAEVMGFQFESGLDIKLLELGGRPFDFFQSLTVVGIQSKAAPGTSQTGQGNVEFQSFTFRQTLGELFTLNETLVFAPNIREVSSTPIEQGGEPPLQIGELQDPVRFRKAITELRMDVLNSTLKGKLLLANVQTQTDPTKITANFRIGLVAEATVGSVGTGQLGFIARFNAERGAECFGKCNRAGQAFPDRVIVGVSVDDLTKPSFGIGPDPLPLSFREAEFSITGIQLGDVPVAIFGGWSGINRLNDEGEPIGGLRPIRVEAAFTPFLQTLLDRFNIESVMLVAFSVARNLEIKLTDIFLIFAGKIGDRDIRLELTSSGNLEFKKGLISQFGQVEAIAFNTDVRFGSIVSVTAALQRVEGDQKMRFEMGFNFESSIDTPNKYEFDRAAFKMTLTKGDLKFESATGVRIDTLVQQFKVEMKFDLL